MEADLNCTLCGATDFYKDAGYYYCNECQTQSQEIQEHVFQEAEETAAAKRTVSKRIRTLKKPEDSLTSWECYNYVVRGLVEELIELGADPKLKQVVRILWFKYLKKLEVTSDKPNALPKLPAVNMQKDAEIIYGRQKRKRKKSRTPSPSNSDPSTTTMDSTMLRRERSKQRRSLVIAQYEEFSNTLQSEEISLHNQSLASLKSGSDTSKDKDKHLMYTNSAKKELLKIMSKNHLKEHCKDIDCVMECHKRISTKNVSWKYSHGPFVLSRNRVYAILYLGLLIGKDKIQLGDMVRFIREGNLSYQDIYHFFPEEFDRKNLNIKNWDQTNQLLTHNGTRRIAAEIAKSLDIAKYLPRQNLVELCQRYCSELNLPDEVMAYTVNLMSKALPRLQFSNKSKLIPNYEGRAISMIIFVLKLIFGLDGATEKKFSAYAETLNNTGNAQRSMFLWQDWVNFIHYRKMVLMHHHFPTKYLYDDENVQSPDLFANFMTDINAKHEVELQLNREAEVLKMLLEKLQKRQAKPQEPLQFSPSLTPFKCHLETVADSNVPQENHYFGEMLGANFKEDTLDFLTKPFGYLEEVNKTVKVGIKHRGANDNVKLVKINNMKVKRELWRKHAKEEVYVQLSRSESSGNSTVLDCTKLENNITDLDTEHILRNFKAMNLGDYRKTMNRLLKIHNRKKRSNQFSFSQSLHSTSLNEYQSGSVSLNMSQKQRKKDFVHYNPHERFWTRIYDSSEAGQEEFDEFFDKFPDSFKFLLSECARIIEQPVKELYQEYTDVEVYLCYVAEFTASDKLRENISNNDLRRLIQKAKKSW